MAKATQRFSWSVKPATGEVSCLDKSTEQTLQFVWDDLPTEIQQQVQCYGIKKVVQDRKSQVDADEKMDAYEDVWNQLRSGTWEAERVSGGPTVGAHITLIMEAKNISAAAAQASWRATSEDFKAKFLEANKEALAEIKARTKDEAETSLDDMI